MYSLQNPTEGTLFLCYSLAVRDNDLHDDKLHAHVERTGVPKEMSGANALIAASCQSTASIKICFEYVFIMRNSTLLQS